MRKLYGTSTWYCISSPPRVLRSRYRGYRTRLQRWTGPTERLKCRSTFPWKHVRTSSTSIFSDLSDSSTVCPLLPDLVTSWAFRWRFEEFQIGPSSIIITPSTISQRYLFLATSRKLLLSLLIACRLLSIHYVVSSCRHSNQRCVQTR
jgi:hypothetical protein